MGIVTRPNTYTGGAVISPSDVTANETTLYTLVNGNLDADNVDTSAIATVTGTQTLTNKTLTSPILNTPIITNPTLRSITGWVDANETWTYSAWDDTNGVSTASITVPSDATTKYQAGMRVMFDQTTDGTKYGIITKVAATELTVFMNTDYDLDSETISNVFYSPMKVPFGFDASPLKYRVITSMTGTTQAGPTLNQWYNINSESIDIPVGIWNVRYQTTLYADTTSGTGTQVESTLSTTNNSESDAFWTRQTRVGGASGTILSVSPVSVENTLSLTTKDTYYFNIRTTLSGVTNINNVYQDAGQIISNCALL